MKEDIKTEMRKLFREHVTTTRSLIVSVLADLKDTKQIQKMLRKNNGDIGKAIGRYFKDEHTTNEDIKALMARTHPIKGTQKLTEPEAKIIANFTAGDTISAMLNNRTLHIMNYTIAKKSGRVELIETAQADWNDNTNSITGQLKSLNSMDEEPISNLLGRLMNETQRQIIARLDEDYNIDFEAFEKALLCGQDIADILNDMLNKR